MFNKYMNNSQIKSYSSILKEINKFIDGVFTTKLNYILTDESDNPYIDLFGLLGYCQKIAFPHLEEVLCDILLHEDVLYDYYEIMNYVRYMFNLLQLSIQNSLDNTLFINSMDDTQKNYLIFTDKLFKLFRDLIDNKYKLVKGRISEDEYDSRYMNLQKVKEEYSTIFYTTYYTVNPELFNDIETVINIYY